MARPLVLVVEDDAYFRRLLVDLLEDESYRVAAAPSGADALAACAYEPPDLLLLDLRLPDMPGVDLLLRLRASGLTSPVLVTSGFPEAYWCALEVEADSFLPKPFDLPFLLAEVDRLCA